MLRSCRVARLSLCLYVCLSVKRIVAKWLNIRPLSTGCGYKTCPYKNRNISGINQHFLVNFSDVIQKIQSILFQALGAYEQPWKCYNYGYVPFYGARTVDAITSHVVRYHVHPRIRCRLSADVLMLYITCGNITRSYRYQSHYWSQDTQFNCDKDTVHVTQYCKRLNAYTHFCHLNVNVRQNMN